MLVSKHSSSGRIEWIKTYEGSDNESIESVIAVDGGYIACGYSASLLTSGADDIVFMKIAEDGTVLWSKVIGALNSREVCSEIIVSREGDALYFTASTQGFGFTASQNLLYGKLGTDGSLLWMKGVGEAGQLAGVTLKEVSNGNLLIVGYVLGRGAGNLDGLIIQTDSQGNIEASKF